MLVRFFDADDINNKMIHAEDVENVVEVVDILLKTKIVKIPNHNELDGSLWEVKEIQYVPKRHNNLGYVDAVDVIVASMEDD